MPSSIFMHVVPYSSYFREEMTEKQRKEIESSPRMNKVINIIYKNDGSLLWWDPNIYTSRNRRW